jgi:hypothetical protein
MNSTGHSNCDYGPKRGVPPPEHPRPRFDELFNKFHMNPQALSEGESSELVRKCMKRGDCQALRKVLAKLPLQTLHIEDIAGDKPWLDLLSALPKDCSIRQLTLRRNYFNDCTGALLLETLGQMPELKSLRLLGCTFREVVDELSCRALPHLQDLHIEDTQKAFPLLQTVLNPAVSQVSKLHLVKDLGMDDNDHAALAKMLGAQGKLRDLALRRWPAPVRTFQDSLKHYVRFLAMATTTLTHLDLSWNPLSGSSCGLLSKALRDKTALISLALAGCWLKDSDDGVNWSRVGMMATLGVVHLDLSYNQFPWTCASTMFSQLGHTEKLQHLDLSSADMERIGLRCLAFRLEKLKLASLRLPFMSDADCGLFVDVVKSNRSLRSLEIGNFERNRPNMTEEEFHRSFENHLALMTFVDRNQREWNDTVLPRGTEVLLGHMTRVDPE